MKRVASTAESTEGGFSSSGPVKKSKSAAPPSACAGVILHHDDALFMVQPTGMASWGIPKGGAEAGEALEAAARREFEEETGIALDPTKPLTFLRGSGDAIKGGKKIHAFLCEGDGTEVYVGSNLIESGFRAGQPENCAGRYMTIDEAKRRVHKNQLKLIELYDNFYKLRTGAQ